MQTDWDAKQMKQGVRCTYTHGHRARKSCRGKFIRDPLLDLNLIYRRRDLCLYSPHYALLLREITQLLCKVAKKS